MTYAQSYIIARLNTFTVINLKFFSTFLSDTYSDQFMHQPLINAPIISTGYNNNYIAHAYNQNIDKWLCV